MGKDYAGSVKETEKSRRQNSFGKHLLSITLDEGNRTKVVLDGVDLSDVISKIKFIKKSGSGKPPVVEMGLLGCDVSLSCPAVPKLPKILRPFYGPLNQPSRQWDAGK